MGGYQLMIAADIRGPASATSFEKPEPVIPNAWKTSRSTCAGVHLQKGHRIMVQVQSTWFPRTTGTRRHTSTASSPQGGKLRRRHTERHPVPKSRPSKIILPVRSEAK